MTERLPDEPLAGDVTEDVLGPAPAGRPRKSRAYRAMDAVPVEVANSIRQRAAKLEKDPEQVKKFFRRALIAQALILDYKARTSKEIDEIKSASAGFIALRASLFPKGPAKK